MKLTLETFKKSRKEIFSSIYNKKFVITSAVCFTLAMTGCKANTMEAGTAEPLQSESVTEMIMEMSSETITETTESGDVQENKKIYYIYDNDSVVVSYEFDTINLYEERSAECITKVINPAETVEIEYSNYGSVICPFPKKIIVNGNELEYDLKYYQGYNYIMAYCMGFTYHGEYYNFLQKNGNISGIEKDGETIACYSYGSDENRFEVTGVFSKNENGEWVLNNDKAFIGNINKIRGSFATDYVHIYDDETGFYIDSFSTDGSSQGVYSYMATEYGLPQELRFTDGRYDLVKHNEHESDSDNTEQIVDVGTIYYSSVYFEEMLSSEYARLEDEEYQAGFANTDALELAVIYDENLNEYSQGQLGINYVSKFGLTYVFQFEDLCLMYNDKEIIINNDGQEYRLSYDLSNPDSPILPVYYIYRQENDKNHTKDIVIKIGEDCSILIDEWDSIYITQNNKTDYDGDGIADHTYIMKNRKSGGDTLYFHSSLSHGEKDIAMENNNISDDDLECIVGVYGDYYSGSYENAIEGADITGDGVNEIFVTEYSPSGTADSHLSVYMHENNEFVPIECKTEDEGRLFTVVRDGTRVKITCDSTGYEEYFWDTINNLDYYTHIYNGKAEWVDMPEYAGLTTYEGKPCIKYTFCLGSKWKWYEINELVSYENGEWKTVKMQADISDDSITGDMRQKGDNSLQYLYEMSEDELLSVAVAEVIKSIAGDVPFRVEAPENRICFLEVVDDETIKLVMDGLQEEADRLNISDFQNENNVYILFKR